MAIILNHISPGDLILRLRNTILLDHKLLEVGWLPTQFFFIISSQETGFLDGEATGIEK